MNESWREPVLNFVGIQILALYIVSAGAGIGLICRYWIAPFLS